MPLVTIASGSQISADAGAAVANLGGNAVDAALAATLVSMCTDLGVMALGASGFLLIWVPGQEPIAIDAYAEMPGRGLTPDHLGKGTKAVFFDYGGKISTIIGYGSIGQAVARMASAFGMRIMIGARPGARDPIAKDRVAVEELFREADFISLHCPLTPESRNLIDERRLALMKPTAFLINTARGALVDEAALIAALRSKKIAAAALDVITKEPPPADHPIILAAKELDNLIVTPHTAWSAREARERLLLEVETNVQAFLDGLDRNRVA